MTTVIQGRRIEARAARYLERQGIRIFARNVYFRVGEIDLIGEDLTRGELVFIEVRSRVSASGRESPLESLGYGKFYRLQKAVAMYLARTPPKTLRRYRGVRIDLIGWNGTEWSWNQDLRS